MATTKARTARSLRLEPMAGPNARPFTISPQKPAMLGRAADCEARLEDASVSRWHASIAHRGGGWYITDLESRHGTFLNGVRLEPNRPTLTGEGDLLRLGPFTLRVSLGALPSGMIATTQQATAPGTIIEPVPDLEFDSLAHRRLALMIDGSAAIHRAASEEELARAVIELVMAGAGFQRAALIRYFGAVDRIEIVAFRDATADTSEGFTFSRSLLEATTGGHVARLSQSAEVDYSRSIQELRITTAICAPLVIDSAAVGAIYVDARAGEEQGYPDAIGFCHAVSRLASVALSSLKRAELEARHRQLDADLRIAQRAQAFLYPPAQGSIGRLRYVVEARPGRIVAGDLFDIFAIDSRRTGICFGDVTGQGMGAALLMTAILSHLRAALARYGEPAAAIADVNAYIAGRSPEEMFASLWVGVFDQDTGVLHYVDAGHGHWMIRRRGEGPRIPDPHGGLLIGIDPQFAYRAESIPLNDADRIALFSDGLIEQLNAAGEEFGRQRLLDVLAGSASIESDAAEAFAAVESFLGTAGLADDTTIASIEVCGGA